MNIEHSHAPENEQRVKTKIILEFMRHGEKENDKTKSDEEVRLTEKGRMMAGEKGEELDPQKEVSLAWGSPKKRTQETALRAMFPDIDPNASLEDIEEMIREEQKFGKKLIVDERLSFDLSGPEGKEMLAAFKEGKYLQYLISESDKRAIELGDKTSSSYLRYAGNISEIINRYAKIGDNFNRIASKDDKYKEFGNQLKRYLATHQGVAEGFVAKVLEEAQGPEKRDEFISSVGSGFKETEGIHLEIQNNGNHQEITITYQINGNKETIAVSRDLIENIIKDREEFEKKITTQ